MNKKQKACLLVSIAAIVVMGLFPPWVLERRETNIVGSWDGRRYEYKYSTVPGPYSWIGNPPQARAHSRFWIGDEKRVNPWVYDPPEEKARFIDLYRLGVQYFIVVVVTAGMIIILQDRNRS